MRFKIKLYVFLAFFLGIALQTIARAVPGQDLSHPAHALLDPRVVPVGVGKGGTGKTPTGATTNSNTGSGSGAGNAAHDSDTPSSYVPESETASNPKSNNSNNNNVHGHATTQTKGGTKTCKRADGEGCDTSHVPTIDRIKEELTNMKPDSCLFYSSPNKQDKTWHAKAAQWRNKNNHDYRTLTMMWRNDEWPNQFRTNRAASDLINSRASQAMAEMCSGVVYVMLRSDQTGTKWRDDSTWNEFEWPNLGGDVTRVVRINPDNDRQEIIR
ncbi:hypothetical protein BDV06DRAFT_219232 [Aspergillus oleicola]